MEREWEERYQRALPFRSIELYYLAHSKRRIRQVSNLETIQAVYEAFGKGDIPAILGRLAPDVEWEQWEGRNTAQAAGVPWMAAGTGPGGAIAFFTAVGSLMEFKSFEVLNMLEGGNQVAVTVKLEVAINSTGKTFKEEEIHMWTFNDAGQISAMRHYSDTAKHIAAAGL